MPAAVVDLHVSRFGSFVICAADESYSGVQVELQAGFSWVLWDRLQLTLMLQADLVISELTLRPGTHAHRDHFNCCRYFLQICKWTQQSSLDMRWRSTGEYLKFWRANAYICEGM